MPQDFVSGLIRPLNASSSLGMTRHCGAITLNIQPSFFPALNASLNATSAVLLVTGRVFIARKRVTEHRLCMSAAVVLSSLFLSSYLYYHFHYRLLTRFPGQGLVRPLYFLLLGTHTTLAVLIVPMILVTLSRALKERFDQHKRIARWTFPLWLYVSVTGVVIYFMLYQWYV